MTRSPSLAFLLLLFVGTVCNSMAVSFMGYYIVQDLGRAPSSISLYTGVFALVVILSNRVIARRLDAGGNPFAMIGLAAIGFSAASCALSLSPGFLTVATAGVIGFGIGSSAMATMFSLGAVLADRTGTPRGTFNAYMRATTSTSWMVGPALCYGIADRFGGAAVFQTAFATSLLWLAVWWWTTPRDAAVSPSPPSRSETSAPKRNPGLRAAVLFVFCLAMAHSLTFTALPVFFVQDVGLPGYAPGMAFSLKTFVELFAIFTTPFLIRTFGLRVSLMGTTQIAIAAILVLATVQSIPHMLFGAALEGLYFGLFSTLAISFVQSLSADRPAHATALYWNTMMLTLMVAGPTAGLVAEATDFRTVVFTGCAFAVAAALILGLDTYQLKRRRVGDAK
ncbi:MAG: MFS transporter [Pseudomonadota bacterium]